MRIAVDAMGGDHAPREIVAGVVKGARELEGIDCIYLVGDEAKVRAELDSINGVPPFIEIVHASEVIGMDESPLSAVRTKKDASINRAVELVKKGEADAVFSAGSTGAAVTAATLKLGRIKGISRPAIATVFPTPVTPFVLVDAGATPDCDGKVIAQFGLMGSIYAESILGVESPRIGTLSIGEEDAKGNDSSKEAFRILDSSKLNFLGNVESRDLFAGKVDVAACDGFVGNVVLKTSEAVAKTMRSWFREEFTRTPLRKIGALMLKGALKEIKAKSDPEAYGGAYLLGVNGTVIIGHGSSSAKAVRNAMQVAVNGTKHRINDRIASEVAQLEND